jgi:hypothetical protein
MFTFDFPDQKLLQKFANILFPLSFVGSLTIISAAIDKQGSKVLN